MLKSVRAGQGYLLADDRASGGSREEADMIGCKHCLALMRRASWQEDGGFCHCCDAPVCGPCADKILTHGCTPFMRQLEQALETDYRRRQFAMIAGT